LGVTVFRFKILSPSKFYQLKDSLLIRNSKLLLVIKQNGFNQNRRIIKVEKLKKIRAIMCYFSMYFDFCAYKVAIPI
jgi:hypothetical protein